MANKLVLGYGKENNKEIEAVQQDIFVNTQVPNTDYESKAALYENVWGNDHKIIKMLDEKQLAERRLYTRAIYMQKIECSSISDNIDSEPVKLTNPLDFTVIDISMGGIGIICQHEIGLGTALYFKLILDNISYDVCYEVVYCFKNDNKYRAGLKIVKRDKYFIRHLKILVARLSLQSQYGSQINNGSVRMIKY